MIEFSSIPFLFIAQSLFLLTAASHTKRRMRSPHTGSTGIIVISSLSLWGGLSTYLSTSGVYATSAFLSLMPGLWLPFIPFIIVGLILLALPFTRISVQDVALAVPSHWWVGIQALRILALGTLLKTTTGHFPVHVELAVGLTDAAFGMSGVFIYRLAKSHRISVDALALWHVVGLLIIMLPGELAIQTGLPGKLQIFSAPPTAEIMLAFPMVLAPSLVVPIFLMLNILGAYAALRSEHLGSKKPAL